MRFPDGFVWGVSSSAYQIEGAAAEDGRGPSIWDTFSHAPGRIADGSTGDEACDHYHRHSEDVGLMKGLGVRAYRFSVSWSRVLPDGAGKVNAAGLDFYERLTDELLGQGIAPYATLYHWDLPQALEDRGGWPNRDTAERFAGYAAAVHERLGDRIDTWFTINEPWVASFLGYAAGTHAPGRRSAAEAFRSAHHMLLAHGLGAGALREAGARRIGVALNLSPVLTPGQLGDQDQELTPEDAEAVSRIDALLNRQFLDPMLRGSYPPELLEVVERHAGLDHVRDGDLDLVARPIDVLGVNYYAPHVVQAQPSQPGEPAFPGSEGVLFAATPGPATAMGWPIVPSGLTVLLRRLAADHPGLDLMVTENGADFGDGERDAERVAFIEAHVRAAHAAISDGVRLRGFLAWTLLDNFEWADGYRRKFGLVHVDFATQRRAERDSARWFRDVIARNGLPAAPRPTLETVAARAGVSRATVSRVVNGEASVRPEVRARVRAAVEELGYVPNQAARSLVTRRTGTVALVLSGPRHDNAALVSAVVQYVTSVLEASGRQVRLMLADSEQSHRRVLAQAEGRHVDGVILLPPDRQDPLAERLAGTEVPLVLLGGPVVAADDAGGGAAVARHLRELGRVRPAVLTGPGAAAGERVRGFLEVFPRAEISDDAGRLLTGRPEAPRPDMARPDMARSDTARSGAVRPGTVRPDAVFAVTDALALEVLGAAREAGLRVPEDLAVAGFGDGEAGRHTMPALTTVAVPVTELALALARSLLSALDGQPVAPSVLPVHLEVRGSTVSGGR
ncbi:GH1 family beta-glucosidase [Nonomuraea sp. NPDC050394]|uniref:GH1 family beta-glucosidase n=1 Tax=Nonomuraea sp. NPDC050394 TaxID=3364363 RepID=UPI0037B077BF